MGTLLTPPLRQPVVTKPDPAPPRLENGDHLSAEEFMRRYEAMPEAKAELIDGIVHLMASPVRHDRHAQPTATLCAWLATYCASREGMRFGTDGTLILGNERPQPDAYLIRPGGRAFVGDDGFIHGPPDLICEVAASTASIDAHEKADIYAAAGVPEYLLWRTNDRPAPRLDWFYLQDGLYHPIEPDDDDVLESRVFPGLRLARHALLTGDLATVLAEVQAER